MSNDPIACAGAIVHDRTGRLLLVQRANPPGRGLWSLPGGRVEPGESDETAAVREVAEETGLAVRPLRLAGRATIPGPSDTVYEIADYLCELVDGGTLSPSSDAADARWVTALEYSGLPVVDGLTEILGRWGFLPT